MLADTRDKEVKGGAENLSKSAIMVYFELQNRVRAKTCVSALKRRVSELKSQEGQFSLSGKTDCAMVLVVVTMSPLEIKQIRCLRTSAFSSLLI